MEKTHELKIKPNYYISVMSGVKRFELRKFDREYEVGDLIKFIVINDNGQTFKTENVYKITYILSDCEQYGLKYGYCILGIEKL